MRTYICLAAFVAGAQAFQAQPQRSAVGSSSALFAYVPAGFTPESWKAYKAKEKAKQAKQNLGGVGPRGFKSRSMQSFQEAMERGEAEHLLPVFNANERIKKGELKKEDIPYMQRGGAWDNSDVKGAKQKKWLSSDKDYSKGGFKKEQSVSIFGYGAGLDWTGAKGRRGPAESVPGAAPKFGWNYKAPNVKSMGVKTAAPKKTVARKTQPTSDDKPKKFFGLF
mmetsp:Transcript_18924/g.31320  ORF Transcript_18924/g.31320 Transcript_18924/m.31320 type:complete len:223 (-) Transcript_18924:82-750(-)|eukprot:CAMPEP_0119010646 /NCGR_PEP_ID=MMETSP1176-20130426/5151_1 /TAXON_ID=265551 /ORGANISM="Synedropsis recta cf, Strain CCMP1620" /LENGTH=222 /DNA_ID=CAMNT_0006963349 /DNA_START=156 /DNA_END=824 /DNA_ORIENTATION=+